jgi:hypothetical protein
MERHGKPYQLDDGRVQPGLDYGVEVCNTNGVEGQFNFTNFSVSTSN